jgi:hypothetical protein
MEVVNKCIRSPKCSYSKISQIIAVIIYFAFASYVLKSKN